MDAGAGRAVPVLNAGGTGDRAEPVPFGTGDDMALAALDLLTSVIAARSAAFRGFHAPAVDDTRRWFGCTPGQHP